MFVCGIALNIDHVLDLFDRLFLLRIDADTQEERLLAYDTGHPPGRSEAGRQQIRDGRPVFEAQMLKLGAIALDGTASAQTVALTKHAPRTRVRLRRPARFHVSPGTSV